MAIGYLFDDDEAGFVSVGKTPLIGDHGGESVVAFFRGGEWVSADTGVREPYGHGDLANGLTGEGDHAAAYAEGWASVSVYGRVPSRSGRDGHIETVQVKASIMTRALAERVVGQLLDLGAVGFGYRVEAMPVGGGGWGITQCTVADLLSRG